MLTSTLTMCWLVFFPCCSAASRALEPCHVSWMLVGLRDPKVVSLLLSGS